MAVAELIDAARGLAPDNDSDERWGMVSELQRRGDAETFEAALLLTEAPVGSERALGADVLAQFGYRNPDDASVVPLRRRAAQILIELCRHDPDTGVVHSAIHGLGHLGDRKGLDAVLEHIASADTCLREAVAAALPSVTGWGDASLEAVGSRDGQHIVAALLTLSGDESGDVRNWALFGLGRSLDVDSPDVRDALARHLEDPHEDARQEALIGLARRGDARAFPSVFAALEGESVPLLAIEAAAHLADDRLLPSLQELEDPESDTDPLRDALRNCDPAERQRWEATSASLAGVLSVALSTHLGHQEFTVEAGREPLEYGWTLHACWMTPADNRAELTYGLVGFVSRLEGDLDASRSIFEHDIAEAEANADRDVRPS
jgi:HEAT repeat protein